MENITMRRAGWKKNKMALDSTRVRDLELEGSLLIDSILSQDEANDVVSMLDMANELDGGFKLPSFYTSSQMGGKNPSRRPDSPALSPIGSREEEARKGENCSYDIPKFALTTSQDPTDKASEGESDWDQTKLKLCDVSGPEDSGKMPGVFDLDKMCDGGNVTEDDPLRNAVNDVKPGSKHDLDMQPNQDESAVGEREAGVRPCSDDESNDGDEVSSQGSDKRVDDTVISPELYTDLGAVSAKLMKVDTWLTRLNGESTELKTAVKGLETSLEYSQQEIDDLKKENLALKVKLGALELEDKRTQFQVRGVEEKMDRLETTTKKKNLLLEGIPEQDGRREHVDKTVSDLFDELNINTGVNIEACYRLGPYSRSRPRPILVTFEKQVDRDLVYDKRMDLKNTSNYKRVWVNEDLGQASKRKRGLVRMIAREALQQGVDCRSGKYALHIDNIKYDDSNWEDLPPQLHPTSLKQVQIDKDTVAYQSEFAPFSNFFPCKIVIGQHSFFCLEQAFQFLKAKNLNKPLAATKIYLSRDVRFIKQMGAEVGTSEVWEHKQSDLMYVCLLRKFQQNPELKALLLATGNLQLVEATPDRLWGCGATLSSNALRRHEWPGRNKHGEILMTVREELKRREQEHRANKDNSKN